MISKDVIEKLTERYYNDAAGFCVDFTKVFVEVDGQEQRLYPKQIEFMNLIKPEENIIAVVKCRQSGFSTGIQGKALHKAYFGKVPEILITSASERLSQRVLEKVKTFFYSMPEFMRVDFVYETKQELKLPNGTTIYSLPANPNTCRGFTGDVFLDEYGVQSRKDGDELWEALLPCISKGYTLTTVSTPKGKDNMFYDLINPKIDAETGKIIGPRAKKVIRVPWWEVPHIAAVADDIKSGMHPKQFEQEYECKFVDDNEYSLFPMEFMMNKVVETSADEIINCDHITEYDVMLSSDNTRRDLKEKYPRGVYMGWDIAISDDGSICTVFGVDAKDVWHLIGFKKFPKNTDLTDQVDHVAKMAQYFCAKKLTFDATGGLGMAAENLLKKSPVKNICVGFKFTPSSKTQEYSELRGKMEKDGFSMPKIDECLKEFSQLGHNPVTGRIAAVGSHRTSHDDWPSSFLCAYAGRYRGVVTPGFTLV